MGNNSGDFVPRNIHELDHCSKKLNFRVLTLKDIYKTIDSLESSKSRGPGFVNAWALKAAKYAIGTHLQIIFNQCIQNSVFPTILKHALSHQFTSVTLSTNFGPRTFAKIFEKLLFFQMMNYVKTIC